MVSRYAPALRQLRQVAFLVKFPPTVSGRLASRLLEVRGLVFFNYCSLQLFSSFCIYVLFVCFFVTYHYKLLLCNTVEHISVVLGVSVKKWVLASEPEGNTDNTI